MNQRLLTIISQGIGQRAGTVRAMPPLLALALLTWGLPLSAAEHSVEVLANRFLPEVVEAEVGDSVVFTVVSGRHQLQAETATPITGLDGDGLGQGDTLTLTVVDAPGEYFFFSTAADNMRGGLEIRQQAPPFALDSRVSSGWFDPAASGQGLLFEYVPSTNLLVAYWFTFDFSSGEQLWLVGTGQPDGDQATLQMVSAQGGEMNAATPVDKPVWGELTVNFADCSRATVWFNASSDQRSGQIALDRLYLSSLCDQEATP